MTENADKTVDFIDRINNNVCNGIVGLNEEVEAPSIENMVGCLVEIQSDNTE